MTLNFFQKKILSFLQKIEMNFVCACDKKATIKKIKIKEDRRKQEKYFIQKHD